MKGMVNEELLIPATYCDTTQFKLTIMKCDNLQGVL